MISRIEYAPHQGWMRSVLILISICGPVAAFDEPISFELVGDDSLAAAFAQAEQHCTEALNEPLPFPDLYGVAQPIRLASFADEGSDQDPPPAPDGSGPAASDRPLTRPLGQAPRNNQLVFLRQETVLLSPGQVQVDCGIECIWQQVLFPTIVVPPGALVSERLRHRRYIMPLAIRWGHSEGVQPYVNCPWGFAHMERANPLIDETDSEFGIGDIDVGVSLLLHRGDLCTPDVIFTLGASAPTGSSPYAALVATPYLGNGFASVHGNLLLVKAYDPAVIFGGIGYLHYFGRTIDFLGGRLQPGEQITYNLGVGFSINDSLTFSTQFQGTLQTRSRLNDVPLPFTNQEPISLRMALTCVASPDFIVEPFVRFGITPDAPQADFGLIFTKTY